MAARENIPPLNLLECFDDTTLCKIFKNVVRNELRDVRGMVIVLHSKKNILRQRLTCKKFDYFIKQLIWTQSPIDGGYARLDSFKFPHFIVELYLHKCATEEKKTEELMLLKDELGKVRQLRDYLHEKVERLEPVNKHKGSMLQFHFNKQ